MKKTIITILTALAAETALPGIAPAEMPPTEQTRPATPQRKTLDEFLHTDEGKRWLGFAFTYEGLRGNPDDGYYQFTLKVNKQGLATSDDAQKERMNPITPYDRFGRSFGQIHQLFDKFDYSTKGIQKETALFLSRMTGVSVDENQIWVARGDDGRVYEVFITPEDYAALRRGRITRQQRGALQKHLEKRRSDKYYHVMILNGESVYLSSKEMGDLPGTSLHVPKEDGTGREPRVPEGYIKREDCPRQKECPTCKTPEELERELEEKRKREKGLEGLTVLAGYQYGLLDENGTTGRYHLLDVGLTYTTQGGWVIGGRVGIPIGGSYDPTTIADKTTRANPNDPDATGSHITDVRDRTMRVYDIRLVLGHHVLPWLIVYGTLGGQIEDVQDRTRRDEALLSPVGDIVKQDSPLFRDEDFVRGYMAASAGIMALIAKTVGAYFEGGLRTNFEQDPEWTIHGGVGGKF